MDPEAGKDSRQNTDHGFCESFRVACYIKVLFIGLPALGASALVPISIAVFLAPLARAGTRGMTGQAEVEDLAEFGVLSSKCDTEQFHLGCHLLCGQKKEGQTSSGHPNQKRGWKDDLPPFTRMG